MGAAAPVAAPPLPLSPEPRPALLLPAPAAITQERRPLQHMTLWRALSTWRHLSTGEQAGSMITQRSSSRTAAHRLPFCSSIKPQACGMEQFASVSG